MNDLRARLRATDPARRARPLDEVELSAMRRAMRSGGARRPLPTGRLAAALAVAASALLVGFLAWRSGSGDAVPDPATRPEGSTAAIVPAPPPPPPAVGPAVTAARGPAPEPRPVTPGGSVIPAQPQVRQVRFVTESGTQILWTFRSAREGA